MKKKHCSRPVRQTLAYLVAAALLLVVATPAGAEEAGHVEVKLEYQGCQAPTLAEIRLTPGSEDVWLTESYPVRLQVVDPEGSRSTLRWRDATESSEQEQRYEYQGAAEGTYEGTVRYSVCTQSGCQVHNSDFQWDVPANCEGHDDDSHEHHTP